MELTDEAKRALKDEFEALAARYDKVIIESAVWNWIFRVAFVVVLGGSIYGLYRLEGVVDDRITSRAAAFDKIYLANALAQSGQYRNALQEIAAFTDSLRTNDAAGKTPYDFDSLKLTPSQRNFFNQTVLASVAQSNERDPNGEYIGKDFWIALQRSDYFKREFSLGKQWQGGQEFNSRLAQAYFRFADKKEDVAIAMRYYEQATLQSKEISGDSFAYSKFICAIIIGDDGRAIQNANTIIKQSPTSRGAPLSWDFTDAEYGINVSDRLKISDFRSNADKSWQRANELFEIERVKSLISSLQTSHHFDQNDFTSIALQKFRDNYERTMARPFAAKDTTRGLLATSLAFSKFLTVSVKLTLHEVQSTNIVDVQILPDRHLVTVRFSAKTSFQIFNPETLDIDLTSTDANIKETSHFWIFERGASAPLNEWKILSTDELKPLDGLFRN